MTESIIPLLSLIALEVILGVDNIIFISILADKLPDNQRNKLRLWGISLAMVMRLCLLAFIAWILKLDQTLFRLFDIDFSGKGLILIIGGLFLFGPTGLFLGPIIMSLLFAFIDTYGDIIKKMNV